MAVNDGAIGADAGLQEDLACGIWCGLVQRSCMFLPGRDARQGGFNAAERLEYVRPVLSSPSTASPETGGSALSYLPYI